MRAAYADPPYIGLANFYPERQEVDHANLVRELCANYDTWALSASSPSLHRLLPMCPEDIRIASWVKPFCAYKKNVNPAYAWEPVIFWHPRARGNTEYTVRDWLVEPMTMKKGMVGAKPVRFCYWVFTLLGLQPGDDLDDLFPGTGVVGDSWLKYKAAYPELCNYGYEPRQLLLPKAVVVEAVPMNFEANP